MRTFLPVSVSVQLSLSLSLCSILLYVILFYFIFFCNLPAVQLLFQCGFTRSIKPHRTKRSPAKGKCRIIAGCLCCICIPEAGYQLENGEVWKIEIRQLTALHYPLPVQVPAQVSAPVPSIRGQSLKLLRSVYVLCTRTSLPVNHFQSEKVKSMEKITFLKKRWEKMNEKWKERAGVGSCRCFCVSFIQI